MFNATSRQIEAGVELYWALEDEGFFNYDDEVFYELEGMVIRMEFLSAKEGPKFSQATESDLEAWWNEVLQYFALEHIENDPRESRFEITVLDKRYKVVADHYSVDTACGVEYDVDFDFEELID